MKIGLYPGSFDPITFGHIDVVERGSKLFDKLYVAVSVNIKKNYLFSNFERLDMAKEVLKKYPNVEVILSEGLSVDICHKVNATHILRGLRAVTDFDNEFQLTSVNRRIAPDIDTVFVMTDTNYSFISSTTIRELAFFGNEVKDFVPEYVQVKLKQKIKDLKSNKA